MTYDPTEYQFSCLTGCTVSSIVRDENSDGNDRLTFALLDGRAAIMEHHQDCCESVGITEIHGDFDDLIGSPLLLAEETGGGTEDDDGDTQWTFYKLATVKGHVTIRWDGSSNGYYSTSVSFHLPKLA